ncbi:MAG: DUF3553 domain-containing protein [Deltaproteobacteria bacterium]|nr:MAG: DUF3553 domain-containing protein [Deltaproteobacteria bacterium]
MNRRHTYLQVGDYVYHRRYSHWGIGEVVEEWNSNLPGGLCFVKVEFEDGRVRIFDNDFKSLSCCYYAGLIRINGGGD